MQHTKCLFGVLVCALVACVARCDSVKEARLLDDNALKAVLELALQPRQAEGSAAPKERVVEIKPRNAAYTHKEKFTLQGERQTHFPGDYPIYALPKRSGNAQEATVDMKPLYLAYAAQPPPQPQPAVAEPTLPYYPLSAYAAAPWPAYPAPYPYAQRALSPYSYGAATPSFVIINPTNYPTYHYYSPSNQTAPRTTFSADEASDEVAESESEEQLNSAKSLEQPSQTARESTMPVEMDPIFVTMPEAVGDERSQVKSILEQARAANGKDHPLLELLLQQEQQPRQRLHERVAAVYFRNYNANRK